MVKTYRSLDAGSMGDPAVLFACRANVYALASEASSGGPTTFAALSSVSSPSSSRPGGTLVAIVITWAAALVRLA